MFEGVCEVWAIGLKFSLNFSSVDTEVNASTLPESLGKCAHQEKGKSVSLIMENTSAVKVNTLRAH